MVQLFKFRGFWLTEKLQLELTHQDFNFKTHPEAEKKNRIHRYYLLHIEIMMFYCYKSSYSYHCFQCLVFSAIQSLKARLCLKIYLQNQTDKVQSHPV